MTLYLYRISNDRREITKTLSVDTLLGSMTAHIKGDTDIMDPVFEIAYNTDYMAANYIYCPDWNRYYFIVEPPKVSQQRLILTCHEDVLYSFKAAILNLNCVIQRQESPTRANRYLADGMFRALAKQEITTPYIFPQAFTKNLSIVVTTGGES